MESNWDTDTQKGTQSNNSIVLIELNSNNTNTYIKLDNTSENYRWITLDPKDNEKEDQYILQALLRLRE